MGGDWPVCLVGFQRNLMLKVSCPKLAFAYKLAKLASQDDSLFCCSALQLIYNTMQMEKKIQAKVLLTLILLSDQREYGIAGL